MTAKLYRKHYKRIQACEKDMCIYLDELQKAKAITVGVVR